VIRARRLQKRFGANRVLTGLDLDVGEHDFLVVTGPNGSGKSTLLALCAGLVAPTAGELDVAVTRAEIGYLAHEPLLYRELTPLENLHFYGRLYRVQERHERIGMLLERFGLWDKRHERVGDLSRGLTQRLALCRALLHEPRLLLLDEPFSGLDGEGADLLEEELIAARATRTLVLATHDPARVDPFVTGKLALA
jgi:ABC-type multidrug transport system ATPase subunit